MGGTFRVFFEDPFWVGVAVRDTGDALHIARIIFGSEPTGAQVLEFALLEYRRLEFVPAGLDDDLKAPSRRNPKRVQREVMRAQQQGAAISKATEAMRVALESQK